MGIRPVRQLSDQRQLLPQEIRVRRHLRSESNPSRIMPGYVGFVRIIWYARPTGARRRPGYFNPNRRSIQPRTNSTSNVTVIAAPTRSQAPSAHAIPSPAAIQTVAAVVRP